MNLENSLSIASSGLNVIQYGMSTASQNIANAETEGYIKEDTNVETTSLNGIGAGVRAVPDSLSTNIQIQKALYKQNANVSEYNTINNALSPIISMQGSVSADPGETGTLTDQLGNIQSSLIQLTSSEDNYTLQNTVLARANDFAQSVNNIANVIQSQRQNAQNEINNNISSINYNLTSIGNLSSQIMVMKNQGLDTTSLENERFSALSSLSNTLQISWNISSNGDMTISTKDGLTLPTHRSDNSISNKWPLSISLTNLSVDSFYEKNSLTTSIPGIMLQGKDATSHLSGGSLGANITLRDSILPKMQAQLDSLSYTVANRFSSQGMNLFTNSDKNSSNNVNGNEPSSILGFSQNFQVSSIYIQNSSFLSSKYKDVIQNILQNTFSTNTPKAPNINYGSNNISTGYSGEQDILSLATSLTSSQATTANNIQNRLSLSENTQKNLSSTLSKTSGVSIDKEMTNIVTLQNAYSANAKVISMVQSMFTTLMNAIGN
ncbi:flagellar hook-associated protein FlgK [Swingsia samuiensis]|uniref:Flagellar hook-associated protein 1 n=1 Tax=Swingsia samuiensis TaxID=1293412 RepID=A0A4Y6UJ81_9PROT|nr:flagellar hook-associated protein FlgK [Swingsia samuiensis]QDH16880.1 flagellar hook-associated protein FlgK [Swingsia samuiensis]